MTLPPRHRSISRRSHSASTAPRQEHKFKMPTMIPFRPETYPTIWRRLVKGELHMPVGLSGRGWVGTGEGAAGTSREWGYCLLMKFSPSVCAVEAFEEWQFKNALNPLVAGLCSPPPPGTPTSWKQSHTSPSNPQHPTTMAAAFHQLF